jgi:hypothetical protein
MVIQSDADDAEACYAVWHSTLGGMIFVDAAAQTPLEFEQVYTSTTQTHTRTHM